MYLPSRVVVGSVGLCFNSFSAKFLSKGILSFVLEWVCFGFML